MSNETLDLRIQNIKAAIERETEGLTADELKVVHAAVATVPSVPRCQHCGQEFNCEMPERVPLGTMCVDCFNSGHVGIGQQTTARRSAQNRRINCPKCIVSSSSSLARRIAEKIYDEVADLFAMPVDEARATDNFAAIIKSELAATSIETTELARQFVDAMLDRFGPVEMDADTFQFALDLARRLGCRELPESRKS